MRLQIFGAGFDFWPEEFRGPTRAPLPNRPIGSQWATPNSEAETDNHYVDPATTSDSDHLRSSSDHHGYDRASCVSKWGRGIP